MSLRFPAHPAIRAGGWLLALGVLAGCAGRGGIVATDSGDSIQQAREASLAPLQAWALSGRLAVSDGRDGGSGRIEWRQEGERYTIEIRAPVSRRTWRLSGESGHALLEGLEGGPREGADAETLLRREVGWSVPFQHLHAWARGVRGPGPADVELDEAGRPARLRQHGWTVEYRGWNSSTPPLPTRVFASNGERRVRLVVERWDDRRER